MKRHETPRGYSDVLTHAEIVAIRALWALYTQGHIEMPMWVRTHNQVVPQTAQLGGAGKKLITFVLDQGGQHVDVEVSPKTLKPQSPEDWETTAIWVEKFGTMEAFKLGPHPAEWARSVNGDKPLPANYMNGA